MLLKRIAITGPESTGKTWLAKKLATHYNGNIVNEYARKYFSDKEYKYTVDELITIAKRQIANEEGIAKFSNNLLFCDTDLIVMKIWSKVVFNYVPEWIEKQVREHIYDLYLLCYPDIVWKPDSLRNNSHDRQYLFELYVNELEHNNLNYRIVKGIDDQRIENAVSFVNELM